MTIFDLVFLIFALSTITSLIALAILVLRRRGGKALHWLRNYTIGVAAYLLIALAVDFFQPQRMIAQGAPWCFDDWCMQVENIAHPPNGNATSYVANLRIYSTARRVSQRAAGAWIYLIDDRGQRYSATPDPKAVPLNVLLGPEESVRTSRIFDLPAGTHVRGLITGHGGPYCGPMSILVIGAGGCIFNRPVMVPIS